MVDWDRVDELRSKGWDWEKIANDPKVGFHPDASVHEPGRALRSLYHRQRLRQERRKEAPTSSVPSKDEKEKEERRWKLARVGYLLVPIFAIWFAFAYFVPSPVGIVLPAIPYLALGLVVAAFLLLYGLLRSTGDRWSKVYRNTLVMGVVIGLLISGIIATVGVLFFGCPVLQPSTSGSPQTAPGWSAFHGDPTWTKDGRPVFYFYGATWCPYCSASSWPIWKALSGFGTWSGVAYMYSAEDNIPEADLSGAQLTSSYVVFVPSIDTSGSTGTFPTTSNCVEQAYVSAYSGSAIPFLVINGQYIHGSGNGNPDNARGTLVQPTDVSSYTFQQMEQSIGTASGVPWSVVQAQTWWMMAILAKCAGASPSNLAQQPYYAGWSNSGIWGTGTQSSVSTDLAQLS
jgi:hypothetical protein